jgi:hypothetical protein
MRYQVRIINQPVPIEVEATEFHFNQGSVAFFCDRLRNVGVNDQWGNLRRQRLRTQTALFTNVESVLEIPEGIPLIPEVEPTGVFNGAIIAQARRLDIGAAQVWYDEAPALQGAPEPMDDDGVNWDVIRPNG